MKWLQQLEESAFRLPCEEVFSCLSGKPRPSIVAVSPTCGHGYEGFFHLSSMHAGDGEGTAQHFTGQAINNACLGRSKREQFFGSCRTSSWWRTCLPLGFLDSCSVPEYLFHTARRMLFILAFSGVGSPRPGSLSSQYLSVCNWLV